MPTWGLPGAIAAGVCMLALAPVGAAGRSPAIDRLHADDANLASKARSTVLELYSVDLRLTAAQRRLARLEAEARRLEAERASLRRQLHLARLDERLSENQLASRLRFLYLHGSTNALEVVLGAKSLDDAITQLDDVNRVATANQHVSIQVQLAQFHLVRLSHTFKARARALAATTRSAAAAAAELGRTRAERAAYLVQLTNQRALDSAQIAKLTSEAQAAEARSHELTRAAAVPTARMTEASAFDLPALKLSLPVPVSGNRTITVSATGYDLSGTTSTGIPVGWGVAAVDPSVIPLGTHLTIPGYGEAIAADTGSSVHGSTIDLWFPTVAQAYAWGRRSVTVALH